MSWRIVNIFEVTSDHNVKGKSKVCTIVFNDNLEDISNVCVVGGGEESCEDKGEDKRDEEHI